MDNRIELSGLFLDIIDVIKNQSDKTMIENISKKSKRTIIVIIAVVLLIILAGAGYLYWNNLKKSKAGILEKAGDLREKLTESATKGTLPQITINPLENKPDINPADKANPFKNIKTNPFE